MGDFATPIPASGTVDRDDLVAMLNAHEGLLGLAGAVVQLASASTVSIAASPADTRREIEITGTTGISSFGAGAAGEVRVLRFVSAGCVVNHSSAIVCPGAANITSEAGTVLKLWKLATGSDWLVFDVWHPSVLAGVSIGLPPGHLFGMTLSNDPGDLANDVAIAAGKARSDDDAANIVLAAPIVKRLDANWAAGTNQGGLDTGSKANSTTYHVFAIDDGAGTEDALFSTSLASPTLPGGFAIKRRLGSVITDGSGNIRQFRQEGDHFQLATVVQDFNASSIGTSRTLAPLTVPAGVAVQASLRAYATVAGANVMILTDPAEADAAPSLSAAPGHTLNGAGQAFQGFIRTDTSRQIAARSNAAGQLLRVWTYGWIDRRGRDA